MSDPDETQDEFHVLAKRELARAGAGNGAAADGGAAAVAAGPMTKEHFLKLAEEYFEAAQALADRETELNISVAKRDEAKAHLVGVKRTFDEAMCAAALPHI
jgi:hypothetical protein